MRLTCIVYEDDQGIMETVVKKIALILGPGRYYRTAQFREDLIDEYDFFVIGSPAENARASRRILDFVSTNAKWLTNKRVALFSTCVSEVKGLEQLEPIKGILGKSVVSAETMRVDAEHLDLPELIEYALKVKNLLADCHLPLPAEQLKTYVEGFLRGNKYCTLCTGSGKRVRGTTINYAYHEGYIYAFCEGGEKFANLLLNNAVCISIFGHYPGYDQEGPEGNRAGLQLSGTATVLEPASAEYKKIMAIRGLNYNKLTSMPFILNGLSIKLHKAEFFWRQWSKMGYGSRQIYLF